MVRVDPGKSGRGTGEKKLFYLSGPAAGGMRSHLQQLLRRFSRDHSIYLGAPPENSYPEMAALPEGSCFELALAGGDFPGGVLHSFQRLCRALRTINPLLLHIHGFRAALFGLPAARLARVPALVTVHGRPAHRLWQNLAAVGRLPGAMEAHYIAVSCALAAELAGRGIPEEQISVIHNGIEPALFESAAAERFSRQWWRDRLTVGAAGYFDRRGELSCFVEAAAVLAPLFSQMRFLLFGEGPGRAALEKLVRQRGLGGRFSFGGRTGLKPRFAGIDLFVFPTAAGESLQTVLEASAAGCAVVAARSGGIPEIITDGVHGLLVPPADIVALARAVATLARDPERARRLARACSERVGKRFNRELMLSRTAFLYRRLAVEQHPRGSAETISLPSGGR